MDDTRLRRFTKQFRSYIAKEVFCHRSHHRMEKRPLVLGTGFDQYRIISCSGTISVHIATSNQCATTLPAASPLPQDAVDALGNERSQHAPVAGVAAISTAGAALNNFYRIGQREFDRAFSGSARIGSRRRICGASVG